MTSHSVVCVHVHVCVHTLLVGLALFPEPGNEATGGVPVACQPHVMSCICRGVHVVLLHLLGRKY